MSLIRDQLRSRRLQLGLQQNEMPLRAGIARQQYHRLEKGGNPSLKTLELAAAGLEMVLMLIPKEKLGAVRALLAQPPGGLPEEPQTPTSLENPWDGLLPPYDDT